MRCRFDLDRFRRRFFRAITLLLWSTAEAAFCGVFPPPIAPPEAAPAPWYLCWFAIPLNEPLFGFREAPAAPAP